MACTAFATFKLVSMLWRSVSDCSKQNHALHPLWQVGLRVREGDDDKIASDHPHERVTLVPV